MVSLQRFLVLGMVLLMSTACCIKYTDTMYVHSDAYAMKKVVMLKGAAAQCSGEQIEASSGQTYILTAAHCRKIADDGVSIKVITADGKTILRKIIAEDPDSDLLLLEGVPGLDGLLIADAVSQGDYVKTFTHGMGHAAYKSEGAILGLEKLDVPIGQATQDHCDMPKNRIEHDERFGVPIDICMLCVMEVCSTAKVVPGSSGGMAVNSSNELIGVVSAGDESFSFLVPLAAIKKFLAGY